MTLAAGGGRRRAERKPMSVFKKFQWITIIFYKDVSHGGISELVQAGCFSEAGIWFPTGEGGLS